MNNFQAVWITLESETTLTTIKQHAFKPLLSKGGNMRNISLCGRARGVNDENKAELFSTLTDRAEFLDEKRACKSCMRIYNKLKNKTK